MSSEVVDQLAGFDVPAFDCFVAATADKGFAVGAEADGIDRMAVAGQGGEQTAGVEVPEFDGVVGAAASEGFAVGTDVD